LFEISAAFVATTEEIRLSIKTADRYLHCDAF